MSGPALDGKVAIVTGAARGIGQAIATLFVREGARVLLSDIDEAAGAQAAAAIGADFLRADVAARGDVEVLVAAAVARFGTLDVMVNNAGAAESGGKRLIDDDLACFDTILRVNLLGVMLGTQIAARHMARAGGGSIVNTGSIGGLVAGHGFAIYRAAKAGVASFTRTAAIEFGEHDIRVNALLPGNVPTTMGSFAAADPGLTAERSAQMVEAIRAARLKRQPLKRTGTPEEAAEVALFLASDRSRYMTGQILPVDGGATAGDAASLIAEIGAIRAAAGATL